MTGSPDDASWIDTDGCRSVAARWLDAGNEWFRHRFEMDGTAHRLDLDEAATVALARLARASAEMWITATALRASADRVAAADTDAAGWGAIGVAEWRTYRRLAAPDVNTTVSTWPGVVAAWRQSSPRGDPGETFDADRRPPFVLGAATPDTNKRPMTGASVDLARELSVRAIIDTGDAGQIGPDEFEMVRLGERQFLVVLPGVTDLSRPHPGLDPGHRTVRDLDRFAVTSATSTSVGDNRYARMVWDGMLAAHAPIGSEVIIVGHSFGADTALDLAADPCFNGAAGFTVTHVVAAGYDSAPQLAAVPERTAVLVLQNADDLVVRAEVAIRGAVRTGPWTGASTRRGEHPAAPAVPHLLDQGARSVGARQVIDVFAGGTRGAGHDPRVYADHLAVQDDPLVAGFLASLGERLTPGITSSWAIDVSIPTPR